MLELCEQFTNVFYFIADRYTIRKKEKKLVRFDEILIKTRDYPKMTLTTFLVGEKSKYRDG